MNKTAPNETCGSNTMKQLAPFSIFAVLLAFTMCKTTSSQLQSDEKFGSSQVDSPNTKEFTREKAIALTGLDDKYDDLKEDYILDEYSGMISATLQLVDGTMTKPGTETFVIRNDEEYTSFTQRIYPYILSPTQPQEENEDRLRRKPPIDFATHMLLVLIRNDNPFGEMQLSNVNAETDPMITIVRQKALSDAVRYSAFPLELGAYQAYLVKKEDREFQFVVIEE